MDDPELLRKKAIAKEYSEALQDGQFAVARRIRDDNKDVEGWCEYVFLYHQPFGVKVRPIKQRKKKEAAKKKAAEDAKDKDDDE